MKAAALPCRQRRWKWGAYRGATGGIGLVADYSPRMCRVLMRRIAQLVPSATAESQRRFLQVYQKAWEWQVIAALQCRVAGKVVPGAAGATAPRV